MKKTLIIAAAFMLAFGISTASFAAKSIKTAGVAYAVYEAEVLQLMQDKGEAMVKDIDDGKEVHIHADKDVLANLAVGDIVKFSMQGSNCVITDLKKK